MAEASVESGIAEAGAVRPMAASVVGTVALLVALLPVETLRTAWEQQKRCNNQKDREEKTISKQTSRQLTVLAQVSTDPWWTAAAPGDRITARTVLALAVERAVFAEKSLRARWEEKTKKNNIDKLQLLIVTELFFLLCVYHGSHSGCR